MKKIFTVICLLMLYFFASANNSGTICYAFLTDIHVSPGKDSESALKNIVKEINGGKFDFVIITGDLTNVGSDAELNTVKNILSNLNKPYYIISGNHETTWSESVCQKYKSLFGDDRFRFNYGKYQFIGIPAGPYMKMGDGHVKEEDIQWLDKTLKESASNDKTLIFAAHYPLSDDLDNWFDVTSILNKYKISFAMCGHGHLLSMHNFDGIPGIMGRATYDSKHTEGYNIIELMNDSVYISEKIIGDPKPHLFTQFALFHDKNILQGLPILKHPSDSLNSPRERMRIALQIENKSSIFTGVTCLQGNLITYGCSDGKIKTWNVSDEKNPKEIWEKQTSGSIYATPLASGDAVIVGTVDGKLTAYFSKSGNIKWQIQLNKPISANGKVIGNDLYIGAGADFYRINASTGKIAWSFSAAGRLQAEPLVISDKIIFGAWDTYLYCLDRKTGKLVWKWTNGSSQMLYSPGNVVPVASKNVVYIVAPDRYMSAIDIKDGKTLWRNNRYKVRESIGISEDKNTIYAKTMNDSIIAVKPSAKGFSLLYALNVGYGYEHNPTPILAKAKTIYLGTREGCVIAIDENARKIKWRIKCGNSGINSLCCNQSGELFVSFIDGKILKFRPLDKSDH